MTLKEIIEKFSALGISEERHSDAEYDERVFYSKEIDNWNKVLTDILGPAIKPAGVKPTKEDLQLTEAYGGIYDNQTLFKKEFEGVCVMAMFWTWQDKVHTTLKMVLLRKN
jgi:hypothetical protein